MPLYQVLVPIVLALILMGAYVMIGAFIYVQWEGWSIMDAAYFTFVTLTTIGFGDLVRRVAKLNTLEKKNSRQFGFFIVIVILVSGSGFGQA